MKYLWECTQCGGLAETEQSMKEDIRKPFVPCIECGSVSFNRIYEVPATRTRTSATYLDGGRKDPAYDNMKRAAKLEVQKSSSDNVEERVAMGKEINRLRGNKK